MVEVLVVLDHRKLQEELKCQKIGEEAFAELVGISDRHVRNLKKRDTNVRISLYCRIIRALSLPMGALLAFDCEKE